MAILSLLPSGNSSKVISFPGFCGLSPPHSYMPILFMFRTHFLVLCNSLIICLFINASKGRDITNQFLGCIIAIAAYKSEKGNFDGDLHFLAILQGTTTLNRPKIEHVPYNKVLMYRYDRHSLNGPLSRLEPHARQMLFSIRKYLKMKVTFLFLL